MTTTGGPPEAAGDSSPAADADSSPAAAGDLSTAADAPPARPGAWSEPPPDPYTWEPEDAESDADEPPEPPQPAARPTTAPISGAETDAPDESAEVVDEATARARAAAEEIHRRDRGLVSAALDGNLDAFNHLVELYQDMLYGLCYRVVGDREAAADAAQEAFLNAYRNLAKFRGDSFRSWLTRIALNAATDILRVRKRRPADPFPEWEDETWQPPADESASPERSAILNHRSRAIARAMRHITEDQRMAIVLFDIEGYDYQEIADMTGVSLGTVKSRIHRGRLALRDLLAPDMELLRD
jgi:RNA polymerase sigma-70 factor (ECF subfamily)